MSKIIKTCVYRMFKSLDKEFFDRNLEASKQCGAVATMCILIGNFLYCVNLGDCRSVLCREGRAVNLSVDHKATLPSEVERIKKVGGYVSQGRLFGRLMITRAFGDFELKLKQDMELNFHNVNYVSIDPDVRYMKVNFKEDRFLFLASDGVFDKMSSQEACDFITQELDACPPGKQDLRAIGKKLAEHVIHAKRVKDNVTIIIVAFW